MPRPLKYTPAYINGEAKELIAYAESETLPFKFGFCNKRRIPPKLMSEWAERSSKFREALELFESICLEKLVRAGLTKSVDSGFATFVLKNTQGWKDRSEIENKETGKRMIEVTRSGKLREAPPKSDLERLERKAEKEQIKLEAVQ